MKGFASNATVLADDELNAMHQLSYSIRPGDVDLAIMRLEQPLLPPDYDLQRDPRMAFVWDVNRYNISHFAQEAELNTIQPGDAIRIAGYPGIGDLMLVRQFGRTQSWNFLPRWESPAQLGSSPSGLPAPYGHRRTRGATIALVSVPTSTVNAVIVKRVIQVALTRTAEPTRSDHTSHPGTELYRVEWTELRNGKPTALRQSHYTEAAARRHVHGLLRMRASGLSIDSVYTESI